MDIPSKATEDQDVCNKIAKKRPLSSTEKQHSNKKGLVIIGLIVQSMSTKSNSTAKNIFKL